jgi:AraC family transcriptional regulator of adaptative response / DNA-3-methyladenine glycosylase II
LRRLFREHLGASPITVAQTQRLHFAKKLIDETSLPMSEVALASGFASVRRFNDAIRTTYDRSPRELRASSGNRSDDSGLALRLAYRPPLRWSMLLAYFEARAIPGVESVGRHEYRRTIRVGSENGWIEVRAARGKHCLVATLHLPGPAGLVEIADRIRRIFDLGAEPGAIADCLKHDPRIGDLIKRLPGVRVPGAWDGFELAVRAILGQQVTVKGATTLAGRLVAAYGERLPPAPGRPASLAFLFPTASRLSRARLERIGLPRSRARTISRLARAVAAGELNLGPSAPYEETVDRLTAIPGIGDWTAQYVAMRALRHPDAFPSGDLGLQQALANDSGRRPGAKELAGISEAWRPWRAYAAICLWSAHSPPIHGRDSR